MTPDGKISSYTTHKTNLELYIKKKKDLFNSIMEQGNCPNALYDDTKNFLHNNGDINMLLHLSNTLTIKALQYQIMPSGELSSILPYVNHSEEFKDINYDAIAKNISQLQYQMDPYKTGMIAKAFIKDNNKYL